MKHLLDVNIAMEYGLNVAVLLEHLKYWIHKNLTNQKHFYDGLCWTYNSLDAFVKQFPYWTRRQIETVINKAVKEGLVVKGNYNAVKYDRTVWYGLTPKAYQYYPELQGENLLKPLYLSISPKCEMEFTEWRNGFHQNVTPIPDNKPDNKPNINTISVFEETTLFSEPQVTENPHSGKPRLLENTISTSGEVLDLNYTQSDGQKDENHKSDYNCNQSESEKSDPQVLELEMKTNKSDYLYNKTNIHTVSNSNYTYNLKSMQEENIFSIPEQMLKDWIINRRKKRAPVTPTAWKKINKELASCQEQGIDPVEAFETMVASGWQSLKVEYFARQMKKSSPHQWDVDSVMRA